MRTVCIPAARAAAEHLRLSLLRRRGWEEGVQFYKQTPDLSGHRERMKMQKLVARHRTKAGEGRKRTQRGQRLRALKQHVRKTMMEVTMMVMVMVIVVKVSALKQVPPT